VKGIETDIEIYGLSVNYRGRVGAAVGEAAKTYYESLYEVSKIKREVINSCAKVGEWPVSYCFA
jgi:hypothetical protein